MNPMKRLHRALYLMARVDSMELALRELKAELRQELAEARNEALTGDESARPQEVVRA